MGALGIQKTVAFCWKEEEEGGGGKQSWREIVERKNEAVHLAFVVVCLGDFDFSFRFRPAVEGLCTARGAKFIFGLRESPAV